MLRRPHQRCPESDRRPCHQEPPVRGVATTGGATTGAVERVLAPPALGHVRLLKDRRRGFAVQAGTTERRIPARRGEGSANPPLWILHSPLQFHQQFDAPMTDPTPRFGFVAFAETWNGRLAMLGFVIGLATELLTGQGILSQIGLG